ncbi:MAG: hypothetical protein EOO60_10495 [Hymenobacter sp.]|nr:MAG: hypothetical protein EOO60_10495 [Hymenobacter sp.]
MKAKTAKELLSAKLPLWLALPEIPRYSLGWRMGTGEEYAMAFGDWWEKLSAEAQQAYQQRYPEPVGWRGWYCEEDWDEDEAEGEEKVAGYKLDGF